MDLHIIDIGGLSGSARDVRGLMERSFAFDVQDYRRAVGRLTFGMYRPYVFRERPSGF